MNQENNEIEESFKSYMAGKVKIDTICDFLVTDINNNQKNEFFEKWELFRKKFTEIENLNISKVWRALIKESKTHWFKELPFNKSCHAIRYTSQQYYVDSTKENKDLFLLCYKEMLKFGKNNILKELEELRLSIVMSFHEKDEEKCDKYLNVLLEFDNLYRELLPQNPDKFLTYMIISQGKQIQSNNYEESLNNNIFFNYVTIKLMDKLIEVDSIGANKLNNKKDSQSLNELYHYFQKYYSYNKFKDMLTALPEKNIKEKKNKI